MQTCANDYRKSERYWMVCGTVHRLKDGWLDRYCHDHWQRDTLSKTRHERIRGTTGRPPTRH
jgi:hypothetical protein